MDIAVIGGGAAGFFAAISAKTHHPEAKVTIYEKSDKLLAKVRISGGGRCNVTHACFSNSQLVKFYPRGEKQLKKAFAQFTTTDTVNWFESRKVKLKTEEDGRMFPVTDSSQTIINCLMREVQKLDITIHQHQAIMGIEKENNKFKLALREGIVYADKVIIASGGSPKDDGFNWLKKLGHTIEPPVPSLFTFNMPTEPVKTLMGVSVESATVRIMGTKLKSEGPLLITHWGMSGPAILKLSAWGARILKELNYRFAIQVNWLGSINEDEARSILLNEIRLHPRKKISNSNPFQLPSRLYMFLLDKVGIHPENSIDEMGKKNQNRLLNTLLNDEYKVEGKTTFKEEFVTCGGIGLNDISIDTMESKKCPGLYFAGEVLDIDGVTGGFNFQAAWTTGFIAGKLIPAEKG
ncbi:MAG TPA: NAD(P)/FAD-dependent oxidoreductase [Bacteroidia bacterium]|jgi:predicted Rossmann fold flavoprotein|nr:NAD(P)/FAD-dependent oxidoreductase [Bacteroidia bacterium]